MGGVKEARQGDRKMTVMFAFCGFLLVSIALIVVLFFTQNHKKDTALDSKARSEQILKKVGELYVLPIEDYPTVAEIKDKTSLSKEQEFYQGAENGDFVLIYDKAKIALLYRESINKLIRVSPVVPAASRPDQAKRGMDYNDVPKHY